MAVVRSVTKNWFELYYVAYINDISILLILIHISIGIL